MTRRIDYQRVRCKDQMIYKALFSLVKSTIAKYGIVETNIYNFDETGFMMGIITSEMVVTISNRHRRLRMP